MGVYTLQDHNAHRHQVRGEVLRAVLYWCSCHVYRRKPISKSARPRITPWERRFFESLEGNVGCELLHAADHMDINYLLIICCQYFHTSNRTLQMMDGWDLGFLETLSTAAKHDFLVEKRLHHMNLSMESVRQPANGRMVLHALQHRTRQGGPAGPAPLIT